MKIGGEIRFADRNHDEKSRHCSALKGSLLFSVPSLKAIFSIRFWLVNILRNMSQAHLFLIIKQKERVRQQNWVLEILIDYSYQRLLFAVIKVDHNSFNLVVHYYLRRRIN